MILHNTICTSGVRPFAESPVSKQANQAAWQLSRAALVL